MRSQLARLPVVTELSADVPKAEGDSQLHVLHKAL